MARSVPESSTGKTGPTLTRQALARLTPERVHGGRNVSKADVSFYRIEGLAIAVKDYGRRPFLARHTVGRYLVGRECRAYERLGALPGLAPFLGRLGPFTLATARLNAVPLADLPRGAIGPEVFDRLDVVVASIHARGVAIADLHHRDVLVGAGGTVHVVDLAAAYVLGPRATPLAQRIFGHLCAQDRLAAARMRARFTGASEGDALAALDPAAVRLWGAGRRVKAFWDRLRRKQD